MYYPIGWPQILDGRGATGGAPLQLLRHRIRNIVFELREHSIAVWNTRLHILLASFKLSPGNINKHGVNRCAALKPDGSCLAIATSNGLVYFLDIVYDSSNDMGSNWKYSFREHGITHHTPGLELPNEGPPLEQVSLTLSHEVSIGSCILVLCPVAGSLMVPTDDSVIIRINWEGIIDTNLSIDLKKLSFSNEQLLDNKEDNQDFIVDICYSLELHGLAIVTSDGKVAFITGKTARFQPESLEGFWLKETTDCVCVAVNPKYSLMVCGRSNGLVDCYILDEQSGSWTLTNTLQLSKLHFADSDQYQLGPVQCLIWSPFDCSVLVVVWKNGGLSMWSVFGSLLFHSLGNQPGTPTPLFRSQSTLIQSACWSTDGYQLWMLPRGEQLLNRNRSFQKKSASETTDSSEKDHTNHDTVNNDTDANMMVAGSHLIVLQFLKSGFVNNPVIPNHNHLLLHSADQVYLGPPSSDKKGWKANGGHYGTDANAIGGLGKAEGIVPQWNIIKFPSNYLMLNWPIKYVSLSDSGDYLVIVGKAGFSIYQMKKRKWKLFGSELQEQNLLCRGGVTWYKDLLVYPCRLNEKKLEEVHFYNINDNLDASRVLQVVPLPSSAIRVNTLNNNLIIASRDCSITIYIMELLRGLNKSIGLNVDKVMVIPFSSYVNRPWVSTLVSIVPSTIRTEPGTTSADRLESLILNIGGKAIMLQREQARIKMLNDEHQDSGWVFSPPVSLAPYVEAFWTPPISSGQSCDNHKDYMMESLWLSCGAHGIKVWLPLYPQDEVHHTFLSKRIMLTLPSSSSFPQCIMLSEAVIVGVSHEPLHGDHTLRTPLYFPPTTVRRITRLFLNHVLRQLLKRNLGSHAFHIAQSHANLPYYAHILELMLHEILEEEASCSIPIPDALLPRAIEFIKQFPEFLETVGSCARKTEIALWQYLFAAVGNPKDLFDACLSDNKLKTAATYLIIIQNLEPASVSRHMASRLLDSALDHNQWDLCRDLVRFLKAIGPVDTSNPTSPIGSLSFTAPPTSNPKTPKSAGTPKHMGTVKTSNLVPDLDQSVASVARHHLSSGSLSNIVSVSGDYYDSSGKVVKRPHFALDMDTKEEYFIELILCRHARKLFSSKCIRDLGLFASHLDFDLEQWMSKERHRAAHIDDYVKALLDLHKQFRWPLPLSSNLTTPTSKNSDILDQISVPHQTSSVKEDLDNVTRENTADEMIPTPENSIDFKANFRRPNRPPDLSIPSENVEAKVVEMETIVETLASSELTSSSSTTAIDEDIIVHSSTPSKLSATESYSFVSDSMIKNTSSDRLLQQDDNEVTVEMLETWENGSDNSHWMTPTNAIQSENEIKYFVELTRRSFCLEWNMLLGILLQDVKVFTDTLEQLKEITPNNVTLPDKMWLWLLEGINTLSDWASKTSPGYLNFLALITPIIHQYQPIIIEHLKAQEELTAATTTEQNIQLATTTEVSKSQSPGENIPATTPIVRDTTSDNNGQQNDDSNSNGCVVS